MIPFRKPGSVAVRIVRAAALLLIAWPSTATARIQEADASQFDDIREPRITTRNAETVLEVRALGDPNRMGGTAFGLLFQLYFSSPQTPKGPTGPVVKARWPSPEGTPRDEWIGLYALPVPHGMDVPAHDPPPGMEARVTTWEYGSIAEVLYIGPYDREQPRLDSLREFAESQGYEVVGGHEEEYVRGPTMSGPGDPEEYLTILRYRVREERSAEAEILTARAASNKAIAAHDLNAVTGFWTDDIVMTAGSGTGAIGTDTWREALGQQFERYPDIVYIRTPEHVELSVVGPLAAERGRWVGRWTTDDGPVESGGTYSAMWRKESGRWRIRSQLFVTLTCTGAGCANARTP